jgi:hypothetical protein
MKTRILIIFFSLLIVPFVSDSFAKDNQDQYTEAKLEWSQYNYKIENGTGTAKIIVTDHDMNKISNYIDTVEVFVYSDSFPEGITITLYETLKDSGVFERTFTLSENRSAPSVLYVREGDTAISTYTDSTLPSDHVFSEVHLLETTLIGSKGPPLERVPASNARLTYIDRNPIESPIIDRQILLTSDIANQQDHEQKFVWIAQVTDENKTVVSLSWIDGTLNPETSFSPSTSWIPQREGKYSVVFFVWESLTNPSALSPPIELEFTVIGETPNKTVSEWDFRKQPAYVIIPLGAVIEGNQHLIPKEITVVLGKNNTITWSNEDDTAHTFVSDMGGAQMWSTGIMKPEESSSVTFNKTGTFEYHGQPGPWITGKVIVLEE